MHLLSFSLPILSKLVLVCLIACPLAGLQSQVIINEYSAANLSRDVDDYDKYEDWIELYNNGTNPVNLQGWHLSDDEDEPTLWTIRQHIEIAPGGYAIFWCSGRDTGLHTNFKLTQTKNSAESIVLTDPAGIVKDKREMKKNQLHHSRGRTTDGASTWSIFTEPSPGASNDFSIPFGSYAERPDFSVAAGFYTAAQTVEITNEEPNSVVRYTTNGTEPTPGSSLYSSPVVIASTKVLKAKVFSNDPNVLPGLMEYSTYFINDSHTLPIVSVAGNDLTQLANGDRTLRPHGSIEYFGVDKILSTRSYGELNSHGQDSWRNDQRSLDWVSRDEMGYSRHLKEKIFSGTDRDEFQRIILRAAGDDNYPDGSNTPGGGAHLRDAYIQNLADRSNLNLDVRRGEKAIVYLNGQYWGVYDLRELVDEADYTEYYYQQDKYDLQYLLTWGNTWAQYGGDQAFSDFQALQDFIFDNDMTVQANFDVVADAMDLQSLSDYVIVNSATVCSDWLNWNTGWWRGTNPDGEHKKWGFILWDNDATFGYYINYTGIPNTEPDASPCDVETLVDIDSFYHEEYLALAQDTFTDPFTGIEYFPGDTIFYQPAGYDYLIADANDHMASLLKLRTNAEFDRYYISRYADLMNTMFHCDTMLNFLESQYNLIRPEMARHINRFGGSMDEWEDNYENLRDYIAARCQQLPALMTTCYNIEGPYDVTFDVDPREAGSLRINTLTIDEFPYTAKYFGGMDTRIEAIVQDATQYEFENWENTATGDPGTSPVALVEILNGGTVTAHFTQLISGVEDFEAEGYGFNVQPTLCNVSSTVMFELPIADKVQVEMFDMLGQPLAILLRPAQMQAGQYQLELDIASAGLTPGAYALQISTGKGFIKTVRMVVQ
jgi:hypothetical protein